jgi:hypothetical protein
MEVVEKYPGVTKISFVGHSLGGIISRYAIGQLYAPPGEKSLPFFLPVARVLWLFVIRMRLT